VEIDQAASSKQREQVAEHSGWTWSWNRNGQQVTGREFRRNGECIVETRYIGVRIDVVITMRSCSC
jgi:hypothetical protein